MEKVATTSQIYNLYDTLKDARKDATIKELHNGSKRQVAAQTTLSTRCQAVIVGMSL